MVNPGRAMAGEFVCPVANTPEPAVSADGVGGESLSDGVPPEPAAVKLTRCCVDLASSHRSIRRVEDASNKLEHRRSPHWPVARLPGIFGGLSEQLLLKFA
jgi:hypothetical protein